MARYDIVNSSKPIDKKDILEVQEIIKVEFPEELSKFYLAKNGGEIEGGRNIYVDEDENDYTIRYIAPIRYVNFESQFTIEKLWIVFVVEKQLIQASFIPFCIDGGGFPYCYEIKTGNIYFANIEHFESDDQMMELIAHSLDEFINGMMTEEEAYK